MRLEREVRERCSPPARSCSLVFSNLQPLFCSFALLILVFSPLMANKKKRSSPSKYQLKRQKSLAASQLVNNSTILALRARSSSGTIHATVHPISNSDLNPPLVSPPQSPCPTHLIPSSSHSSEPQHCGDSPSINHVFVAD